MNAKDLPASTKFDDIIISDYANLFKYFFSPEMGGGGAVEDI